MKTKPIVMDDEDAIKLGLARKIAAAANKCWKESDKEVDRLRKIAQNRVKLGQFQAALDIEKDITYMRCADRARIAGMNESAVMMGYILRWSKRGYFPEPYER